MKKVLIINGPNLNMLGKREPEIYGHETLLDIEQLCKKESEALNLVPTFWQSNDEGAIITKIQEVFDGTFDGVIINAAAYTHTSIGIADALSMLSQPIIEVHLSNIHKREKFRHRSRISPIAGGVICGFGAKGYILALHAVQNMIENKS